VIYRVISNDEGRKLSGTGLGGRSGREEGERWVQNIRSGKKKPGWGGVGCVKKNAPSDGGRWHGEKGRRLKGKMVSARDSTAGRGGKKPKGLRLLYETLSRALLKKKKNHDQSGGGEGR